MNLTAIRQLTATDLAQTNAIIVNQLQSDITLINAIATHIIESGGKRIRPLLAILTARALGYTGDQHSLLAAIIELIHTATLLHDDVVDNSALRRGQATANAHWDNAASVLTGDFLYSRSFQLMVKLDDLSIMDILADASNRIAEGEVAQLQNCHQPDTNIENYMTVIEGKTATLFAAATKIAAMIAGQNAPIQQRLWTFGQKIGTAFQIIDDVMDYSSDRDEMGKNLGDDLAEGKPTLPLIYAMQMSGSEDAELIRQAILHGDTEHLKQITAILKNSGALDKATQKALEQADTAKQLLDVVPDNEYRQALLSLCDLAVKRKT